MILFPCEHCGKVICTDDQSASQRVPCPYCQGTVVIPEESVVDCCLVYQDPNQPQGQPMSATELQEQLEAGNLNPSDLIWTKQVWRPLYQVLNMPLVAGDPQTDQPEVAIRFEEMPPIPGYAPLPKSGKRKKVLAQKPNTTSGPKAPSEHITIGQFIKKLLFVVVAVGVLFFGVVRALRIFNYATKRLASVMIYNGTGKNIFIQFPFSGFEATFIQNNSHAVRDNLVVGLPCHKSMKIWNYTREEYASPEVIAGVKADQSISVPIRPNHDTAVILGDARFPVFRDFNELCESDQIAPAAQLQAMTQELAENLPPKKVKALFEHAQARITDHLVKMETGPIFTDQDYDLSRLNILRGERPESTDTPTTNQNLFVILRPFPNMLSFANGSFTIAGEAKLEQLVVKLPTTTYHPPIPGLAFQASGNATLSLLENGGMRIEITLHQQNNKALPQAYQGNWRYFAELPPGGNWTWNWFFNQPGKVTQLIEANGTVSAMMD